MDEKRLLIFRTVAELRNFSRAAETLHLSQPTISQQVQALEEHYGVRLFDRTSKTVDLTAAGRVLYSHVIPLLQQHAEVKRAVLQAAGDVSGPLTLGASMTIGQYVLPQGIAAFFREHPGVEIRLQIHNSEHIASLVHSGTVDLGLVEGAVIADDLVEKAFLEDELVAIAHPEHPWRTLASVTLADLLTERFIMRESGSGTRQVAEEHLLAAGIHPDDLQVVTELAGQEAIKGAVEAGMGVAIISRSSVRKELQLGTLLVRSFRPHPIKRMFRFIYPRGRTLVPAALALMELLQSGVLSSV